MDWLPYDLALLHSASRFDLSNQAGRTESARWLRQLFIRTVATLRPRLVLELGAAEASFSREVAPLLDRGEVHAFEANPYVHRKHAEEAQAAGVRYHNLALGRESGAATFKVGRSKDGKPLLPNKTNNSILTRLANVEYEEVSVQMVSVDDFVARNKLNTRSCAMWVDVEGLAHDVHPHRA